MMQLYDNPASPFCRKVKIVALESGQMGEIETVPAVGNPLDSSRMPVTENPLGKIPALIRPDGPAIYDSRVICRYLDDRGGGGLYPDSRLWEVLTLEATADGIMDAAVLMVYEARCRPEERRHEPWVEGQWAKIERALDTVISRWMGHLAGRLDIGQVALGAALGYLDFRHGARDWRQGRAALGEWYETALARPSFADTVPRG